MFCTRGLYRVRLLVAVLFAYFSCLATSVFANVNLQGQTPHAEFLTVRHNFGNIYQGQILLYRFPFKNTGNGTLILTSLHVSCGCVNAKTLADDSVTVKNIFKPGEKGFVSVSFDSSQFSGDIVRTVTVETNSTLAGSITTLFLDARIKQEISASPAMLYLGKIQKDTEQTFDVDIDLHRNNLKILSVESDLSFISAKLISSVKNPQSRRIVVKLNKSDTLPIGHFQGNLIIKNTSEYYENFKVPIVGEVTGHVQVSTKFLEFGVVNNKDRISDRSISFQSKRDDFEITGVKVDLNNFSSLDQTALFEIQKSNLINKDGINECKLNVQLKYPDPNDVESIVNLINGLNVSGSFLIETNDPDYAQIKVPFFGVLKQN